MPLVVPVLRFFVVFLNVYETFKTLKPPPPSARRTGKPSARALAQRKRDLKGCLAVWVVWCCYAAYERTFDRAVGIFLPFYSEIKSIFLLFLLLTRAKGAEPLFLHVLRPLVKPYVPVVDPTLELSCDLGDFLFALLQIPVDYALSSSWLPSWRTGESEEESGEFSSIGLTGSGGSGDAGHSDRCPNIPDFASDGASSYSKNECQECDHNISDNQCSKGHSPTTGLVESKSSHTRRSIFSTTASLPLYSECPSHELPQYPRTPSRSNARQVHHSSISSLPTSGQAVTSSTLSALGTAPEYHSPEWRTYPAFPSAYPPTPLPVSVSLPNSLTRSGPIPENKQVFSETLEGQHMRYPNLVYGSRNNNEIPSRIDRSRGSLDLTGEADEDTLLDDSMCSSETGLSEDDLGTSLRTPHLSPEAVLSSAHSSVDSLTSAPSVTDNTSPLRAKTSSGSLSSGSSSLVGRKRTHGTLHGNPWSTHMTSRSQNTTLRGKPASLSLPQDPLQSSASENEHESEVNGDGSTKAKRRKILDPLKRKSTVRLVAKGSGSGRKVPLPSRSVPSRGYAITTASQVVDRARTGSVTTNSSTIKARNPTLVSRQVVRGGSQGVVKSSSTSSSQSGTLRAKGR